MNEPLLNRIARLERSVKRWRLVSLVLAVLLICVLAVAGIVTAIPAGQERGDFWLFLPWVRARHQAERAREEELRAFLAAEAARRAAQEAKRAGHEAAKKKGP